MRSRRKITDLVKEMRKKQTPEEDILWQELRRKSVNGFKFLRQHPIIYGNYDKEILFFVADFYCAKAKLIIEVDGKIHDLQKEYDSYREGILKDKGLTVLRIKNEELVDVDWVLKKIAGYLNSPPTPFFPQGGTRGEPFKLALVFI
jgi:very-short-patch-repair endonuclease